MKKIMALSVLLCAGFINAQAFKGKGDVKAQVGLSLQSSASGINVSTDFGLGENISLGVSAVYLLSADNYVYNAGVSTDNANFIDRFDLKARFNANLGNVFKLDPSMDVYPGLDLGLRNFGAHAGFRYFFTDGFGLYGEAGFPIAKYDNNVVGVERYNNQFVFNVGASFNIGK